jgi:hypothetical protein
VWFIERTLESGSRRTGTVGSKTLTSSVGRAACEGRDGDDVESIELTLESSFRRIEAEGGKTLTPSVGRAVAPFSDMNL